MTTAGVTNSNPPRKQLSDQIDRLDGILDGLSEGLNSAVADAAREGTRLAVKDAVIELMTDPTLRARLHEATAPKSAPEPVRPAKQPGFWARLKAKASQAVAAVGHMASHVVDGAVRTVQAVSDVAAEGVRTVLGHGVLKNLGLLALGAGVAIGVTSFLAPHVVPAAIAGISGAVAAAVVQIGVWTRRTCRALALT